ncbi:MAG: selenium metabolism-associated LysR family transcriptional regulator [Eubacteriales bacterium]|nr:selenium metabolism-associated LysR family transcriptional regulator [Eubacteriales bacterium]
MEFKQLEAFVSVVEWNSFSAAAKQMYLTQPTISSHIRSLEAELNTTLLNRTTKHIEVTKEGQFLYEEAKKLLRLRNHIYDTFSQNPVSTIRLGASTVPSLYILPNALAAFRQKYPMYRFDLWQSDSMGVISAIKERSLDLGFVGTKTDEPDYTFVPIAKDELVIATPADDYYRGILKDKSPMKRLLEEPIILRDNTSGTRKEATRFLENMDIHPSDLNVTAQMNDQEMIKNYIKKGLGISIMSGFSVAEEEQDGSLLVYHLGKLSSWRNLYIVYDKTKKLPPHLQQFIHITQGMYLSKP